jgi:diguanylate cyclase
MGVLFGLINYFAVQKIYKYYKSLREINMNLHLELKTDKLTGLLNRRSFEDDIRHLKHNERYSLIFIDIDNFRSFNNRFGHQIGDLVLNKVAQIIIKSVRPQDKVYRYGGEEIVILLKNCHKKHAYRIAERIRKNICNLDNSPYPRITVSLGISSCPEDGENIDNIILSSDKALLLAKNHGKNCSVIYN